MSGLLSGPRRQFKWPGPQRLPSGSRVRLSQRQVFILPTASGLCFAGALLIMLVAAINYQNSLAYALTFLLGSMFWMSILHTWLNLVSIELVAAGVAPVFAGEPAVFRVNVVSPSKARPAISLGWRGEKNIADATANLEKGGSALLELGFPTTSRGRLRPGQMRVETRYPLGLLVAWSWVDLRQEALVYPRPLEGPLPSSASDQADEWAGESGKRIDEGTDDYQGLREYQAGDSLRRLYWKAYSRGQGLQVKRFNAIAGQQLYLNYDALQGSTEARLSQLCYWVLKLSENAQSFALILPGVSIPLGSDDGHRDKCLRALALYGG